MTTDPDGDSQMASSPESTHHLTSDDSPAGARTPTNTIPRSQFAGAAAELSPPGSQTHPTSMDLSGIMGPGKGGPEAVTESLRAAEGQQQKLPSWMSKRAEEEYQRAMEAVVDQDFSLDEFGDPFDESDMKEKLL
ncbi:hypothetical protein ATEIFO6365_0011030700 [Aspergillus terreus]|uniref:Uncharacterized protein n=1 Tax=Aspergillus terreus TaxID=33178 RepID=A0A5M3Z038_ASPTE|nr:hypothetical protein ATETN484_0006030700 [Aspergillus terreus]GFF20047.1 hypothetical protein ATEIFO6365_0011030700 [Aspergillus terreus]